VDNPLYAAANAARLARYARPQQSGYAPEVASQEGADTPQPMNKPPEMAAPAPQAKQEPPSTLLQSAGGAAASGLSAVANAIDLPGSVGRDLLTWLPGGLAPHNPLDQLVDPFGANAHKNRIEGREINRSYGLSGPRDTWGNFATGLVLEMASDPLTYTGLGVLGKGAKALSTAGLLSDKAGLIKEMAEAAGRSSKKIGGRGSSKRVTVGQVFDHWKSTRDRLIKESTDGKVAGSRLKSKNTYSNLDELKDMSPDVLKDKNWAVVDNGGKYDIYQWKGGEWTRLAEPSESLKARLRQTNTNQTLDSIRSAYNSQLKTLYPGVNPESLLNKPLESIVSFRAPFTQKSIDVNIPDAAESWNRHLEKQPIEVKSNKAGSTAGDATPLDSAATGGKPKASSAASDAADAGYNPHDVAPILPEELKTNAKKWGLEQPDGSIKTSPVGPEATRVLHQAAKTFGKEAVDTWDVIETAGVGAARLKGISPEEFFKNISISGGTKKDLQRLKEGGALTQPAVVSDGMDLAQKKASQEANGAIFIDGARKAIKAFKDGNISTLHHEFAHAMRQSLDSDTLSSATEAIASRLKAIDSSAAKKAKKSGAEHAPTEMFNTLDDGTKVWSREAEEVWASSWERYLKEGKSPVKALEPAFEKLKLWLTDIYKRLVAHPSLSRQLDKKTREIFDKIIEKGDAELRPVAKVASEAPAATGVPAMMTRAMESALKSAGYTQKQIDNLTPQQAWDELSSKGLVGKDGSIAPNVPTAATGATAAASGAVADAIPPASAETPLTGTVGASGADAALPGSSAAADGTTVAQDANVPPKGTKAKTKPAEPSPDAPYEPDAIDTPDAAIKAVLADKRKSAVDDVVAGATTQEAKDAARKVAAEQGVPGYAPQKEAPNTAPQRGAPEGPVKAKGKARSISDSLTPRKETPKTEIKSGADILTGRTRAKGKARSIEDSLAPSTEQMPTMPQKAKAAAPLPTVVRAPSRNPGLAGLAARKRTPESGNALSDVVKPKKKVASTTARETGVDDDTLHLLRKGADGDKNAIRALGIEEDLVDILAKDLSREKTAIGRLELLATHVKFANPRKLAESAVQTVAAAADKTVDAAKKAANRKLWENLFDKHDVWGEMQKAVGTSDSPNEAAIAILGKTIGKTLKDPASMLPKLHEDMLKTNTNYELAVDKLRKAVDTSTPALTDDELKLRKSYIKDPQLESVAESDILAPAPRRLSTSDLPEGMTAAEKKAAISENERAVDLHEFRKLNLLKKQGNRAEADKVARSLAEHYMHLPGIVVRGMVKGAAQVDDLISDGSLVLLNAIEKFDYTQGNKFATYFSGKQRGPMANWVRDSWRKGKPRSRSKKNPMSAEEMLTRNEAGTLKKPLTELEKIEAQDAATRNAGREAVSESYDDVVREKAVDTSADEARKVAEDSVEAIFDTVDKKHQKWLKLKMRDLPMEEMEAETGLSANTIRKNIKEAMSAASKVKVEFTQLKNPPKAVMKDLYSQTREAYDKVLANMKDESLRERYATMLDNGEHLFSSSLPVRQFNRYFDKSVFGQNDLESQQLARKVFRSVQRAIFDSREFMAALTRAVGEHGLLDEQGAIRKLTASGMGLEEAKVAARSTMNKRNSEMVRFMENAVDKTGKKVGLNQELFGGTQVANDIEQLLTAIKYAFPERLYSQKLAGLSHRSLTDTEVDYFPRFKQGEYGRATKNSDIGDSILDASLSSQKKRNPAFKNVPGGRSVLDDMSVDGDLSGVYWKQLKLGDKPSKAMIQRSIDKMMTDEYKLRVFNPDIHFNEDGTLNKLGKQKGAQLALAMAMLPPIHAANNMPLFGRNMLHDIAKHIQDSIAREGVARAAQDVVANNVLPAVDKTEWTLSKLFEDIDLDRHQAYLNVIDGVGKRKKYNSYAKRKIADIKKKLVAGKVYKYDGGKRRLKVNEDGQFQVFDLESSVKASGDELAETTITKPGRIIPDDQLADEINLAKKFAANEGMSVNKNTFETATQYMSGWKQPKEISDIQRFFRASLSLFKTNVTLPFLSFHVRNFLSGNAQNWFYGAFDPSAKGTKSLARYTRPIKQAWDMRSGKTVAHLYEQLPTHIRKLVDDYDITLPRDEAATGWMREQVFKYGITGDKQGYAAEQIGDSLSSLTSQYPGAKAREQSIKNLWGVLRDPQKGVPLKDKVNLLHVRGGGRPAIVQDELGKSRVGVKQYDETTSTLHRTGEDLAQTTEDMNRISPFIAFIKQGNLPEEAAAKVQRIQIDYSNLSESEKALRNWIPFWTFSSKVMYLTLGDLINNPGGKQAWAIRAANRAQKPDALAPDHIKRSVAIPWGTTESGANRYLSGLGLPFEDPLQFAGVLRGDVRGLAGEVIGRVRPELQALAEQATGRSLFFDKELDDMDPPIGRILSNVKHAVTGVEPRGLAEPFPSKGIEWAVGKSPASRYISTLMKATDQRKSLPYKLANTASGLKFTDVEPEAQERIAIDQMSNYLKQGFGGREFARTYVPDWAKERLSQEKLRELESVQAFIAEVQKKGRERKKANEGLKDAVSNVSGDFVAQ
jgi:RNA polymerase sigma factor (sigma-70 family)